MIEILEVGGSGGVFQHAIAVAVGLVEIGQPVRIHTSADHELSDDRVLFCHCFDWKRDGKPLRGLRISVHFLFRTVPHLIRTRAPLWIQGMFKPPLTLIAIAAARLARKKVTFSPHTLFIRHGGLLYRGSLAVCLQLSSQVVVYNDRDETALAKKRIPSVRVPLFMFTPRLNETVMNNWRGRLTRTNARVCSVGQIREDKNLPMLMEACRIADVSLVIVGADTGGGRELARLKSSRARSHTQIYEGYYPLEDIAAVLALSGLVALPYSVASQSAVAVLAKAYGAKVIAYSVGGLEAQADVIVTTLDAADWAVAIRDHAPEHLVTGIPDPRPLTDLEVGQLTEVRSILASV